MAREIVVNSENGEIRAAILEDGVLVDLFIERSLHPRYAGNIYRGIVENVLPGMQAAFVDVGLERNVFLYVDDALAGRNGREGRVVREADGEEISVPNRKPRSIKDILKPGQEIIVQVSKEPIGTKGARVVTDITLPGRYVVLMPTVDYVGISRRIDDDVERDRLKKIAQAAKPKRMGVIVRTVAEGLSQEEIAGDIQFLVKLWRRIQARGRRAKAPALLHKDYDLVFRLVRDQFAEDVERFVVDDPDDLKKVNDLVKMFPEPMRDRVHLYTGQEPIFDSYALEEEIARALRRKVWLACGGYLVIDHTEALTVIDVNTGKYTGSTCLADTVLKTNLEAASEVARQMRLRNIGGIIIADFIDMDDEDHQKQVAHRLEEALARDKTKASVLGFTQLGLIEMTRKKVQQGLAESMMKVCPMCDGRGRIPSEETLAFRAMRAIKKEALSTSQPAMLVLLHPSVAAVLIGSGGSNLASLEQETGKSIYVKGSFDQPVEDIVVAAVGTREDVEKKALPVVSGDVIDVVIEEPHMTNSRDGIARLEGYVIDVEGAGRMMGTRVKAKITKVFKTYARARLMSAESDGPQEEQPQEPSAPAVKAQEPAAKDQAPAAKAQEPAAKAQEPAAKAQQAVVKGQAPAAKDQAPAAKAQQAAVRRQTPTLASPQAKASAPAQLQPPTEAEPQVKAEPKEPARAQEKAKPKRPARKRAKAQPKPPDQAEAKTQGKTEAQVEGESKEPARAQEKAKPKQPARELAKAQTKQPGKAQAKAEQKVANDGQGMKQPEKQGPAAAEKDDPVDEPVATSSASRGGRRNGRRSRRGSGRSRAKDQSSKPLTQPVAGQVDGPPVTEAVGEAIASVTGTTPNATPGAPEPAAAQPTRRRSSRRGGRHARAARARKAAAAAAAATAAENASTEEDLKQEAGQATEQD